MPYIDGKRVSMEEWLAKNSFSRKLHTGPNGENPAADPILDEETGAPVQPEAVRSPRSAAAATAAIADALGTTTEEVAAAGIDPAAGDDSSVPAPAAPASEEGVACDVEGCGTVAKTAFGLQAHKRAKHKESAS